MPRSRLRRVLTVGGLLLAALLLVVALGLFPQEPVRRTLEARLREATGPGSRIGSAEVRPGALWVELRDVVVEAPGYRLEAARLEIAVFPRTLAGHGLHLRRVVIDGASMQLRPDPAPATAAINPWLGPLTIEQVQAAGARLTWDADDSGPVRIEGISIRGSVGSGQLRVASTGGAWERTPAVALSPAEVVLSIAPDLEMRLDSAHAGLQRSRITASGFLGRPSAPAPDLAFDARLALDELAALGAWPAGEIDGLLRATGRVHGTADAPVVEARLASERVRLRAPMEQVEGTLTLREGRLDGRLQARALGGTALVTATRTSDGRIDASAFLREVRLEQLRELGVEGDLSGVGHAELTLRGNPATRLAVELTTRARGQAAGEDFDGEARAQGHVAADGALDAEWTAAARTAHGPVDGAGQARAAAGGALEVAGRAQARPAFQGWPEGAVLDGTFRLQAADLSAHLDLSGLGQPLVVEAVAETPQGSRPARFRSLRVEAPALDLARVFPGEMDGRASLRFDLAGPVDALDGGGQISIDGGLWRGVALGPVTADVVARGGIAQVAVAAPELAARLDGRLSTATRRASGELVLDGTDLARGSALAEEGEPIAGAASGTVHFDVPLDRPAEASLEARFTSLAASHGAWSAHSVGDVELALRDRVLHLQRLVLAGAGAGLEATGRVTLADEPRLDLTVLGRADLAELPRGDLQNLGGRATLEARITGTLHEPRADGWLRVEELTAQAAGAPVLAATQVDVTLAGDRARLAAQGLTLANGQLELEGEVPFGREPARLALSWSGVSAAEILRAARPASVETLEAALAGRLDVVAPNGLRNTASLVRELEAQLHLEPVQATTGDLRMGTDVVEATLRGGQLNVAPFSLSSSGSRLEVRAAADLERRELSASGRGEIELRALSPLLSDTALTGRAVMDIGVDGPWSAPRTRGTLEVQDATARARSLPQALTDIAARLRFDGTTVRVETATARLGGGPLTVTGAARLAAGGLADAAFDIQLRDAALRYPPGLRTRIGADLRLTGAGNAWLLAGDVRSARGLYDLDEAMAAAAAEESSPLLRALRLDLRVRTEAPIAVISNLGELQATGNLRIRGNAFAPEPFGALRLASGGRVYIQGREFRVDPAAQSALTYGGTWDPTLAIHAVTAARVRDAARNREVEVKVALEGRLESPGVRLEAAGYSESELLNLLATGDSRASAGRAAVGAQAAAVLVGRVGRQIRSLGLDEVSIQPELVAREGEVDTGARFTVGKRVAPWASLVYSASLQDPNARYLELKTQPGVALGLGGFFDAGA
ncbi:MAG: translocation/assembly module TamB domain-containing protein, partial [Vicinamibacteria bacterium]|nr:translocation/assembly module TamB domain-containing protein [Vicinamibacteria bacterium]